VRVWGAGTAPANVQLCTVTFTQAETRTHEVAQGLAECVREIVSGVNCSPDTHHAIGRRRAKLYRLDVDIKTWSTMKKGRVSTREHSLYSHTPGFRLRPQILPVLHVFFPHRTPRSRLAPTCSTTRKHPPRRRATAAQELTRRTSESVSIQNPPSPPRPAFVHARTPFSSPRPYRSRSPRATCTMALASPAPCPHPTLSDWRFVRAFRPFASAVAPLGPRSFWL
jgi:hypothetical protein